MILTEGGVEFERETEGMRLLQKVRKGGERY